MPRSGNKITFVLRSLSFMDEIGLSFVDQDRSGDPVHSVQVCLTDEIARIMVGGFLISSDAAGS